MRKLVVTSLLGLGLVAACGGGDDGAADTPDDGHPDPDATPASDAAPPDADLRDLADRLSGLPGVAAKEFACRYTQSGSGRCFLMTFEQPVDHTNPSGPTFLQHATLRSEDLTRPTIAYTTGYDDYWYDAPTDLSETLHANQISIEYRFFGQSRPEPADWTKLTIEQAAADEHHIIELLKGIYPAPWLTHGGSKGGMTATYHLRFWPGDVAGAAPFVAPMTFGAADPRYSTFLDGTGTPACRQKLRDLEVELLKPARFDALLQRAATERDQRGLAYTRVLIGPAVEAAITGIEWAFWQYHGVSQCSSIPSTTATDQAVWSWMHGDDGVSQPSDYDDASNNRFDAYYYQTLNELGGQDPGGAYTDGLTRYTDADYDGIYPLGVAKPTLDLDAMLDIQTWIQTQGAHMLFLYGEYDPYTAGYYRLGNATDSAELFTPMGTHNGGIAELGTADRATAIAKLAAWSGVTPDGSVFRSVARRVRPPRVPHIPHPRRQG